METFDISPRRPSGGSKQAASNSCARLIPMRRYTFAVCVVQALLILMLLYLLLTRPYEEDGSSSLRQHSRTTGTANVTITNSIRTYSLGAKSIQILTQPIKSCTQRKHDLPMGVPCASNSWQTCQSVEKQSLTVQPVVFDVNNNNLNDDGPLQATVVVTSKAGLRLSKRQVSLKKVECNRNKDDSCKFKTRLEIRPELRRQKVIGWGGGLTDSTINNLLSLTTNGSRKLLDDYFGENGLKYNMIRITIGGSDFSSRFYTNDDSQENDLHLNKFKLQEEDILYKIPVLKLIQQEYSSAGNRIKLLASMWSPPVWMKTNGHFNKGQLKGSIDDKPIDLNNPPKNELYYNALAELKIKFISAYQEEGLDFWGLTVMNEPIFSVQPFLDFNTMIFPREDYGNYVAKYLGPKIRNNNKLAHIQLIAHDDNRRFLEDYTIPLLDQTRIRKYIDGVSVHGYIDQDYALMDEVYNRYQQAPGGGNSTGGAPKSSNFFILHTELCSAHLPFMEKALVGNWHRGVHYGLDIIASLQHSAAGWVDWNMALDLTGGPGWLGGRLDAPILVDKTRDLYHKSPMFYVLGQFSRYIPPDSVRVETQIFNDKFDYQFETVTFELPDGKSYATVVLNNNPYEITVSLKVLRGRRVDLDKMHEFTCDANSITTIIFPKIL